MLEASVDNLMGGSKSLVVRNMFDHGDISKLVESFGYFRPSEFHSKEQKVFFHRNPLQNLQTTDSDVER